MNSHEFKERYVFDPHHDLIAEGTYSRVFRAVDSLLQRDICIKYYRKELIAGSPLIKELSRAGSFFHPNICAFYDLVEIEEINVLGETDIQPIGIVEYVNGGMLTDYVRKHSADADVTKKLIKDIIKGLTYLHSLNRPHLDIKPGNLLVKLTDKDPIAKIADFLNNENIDALTVPSTVKAQQLSYKAPEYFEGAYGELTAKADIWALGLIVFELVTGERLFYKEGDTVEKVIRNICHSDHWVRVHNLPEAYMTFVKKCLVRNTQERNVSLEELTLILEGYKADEPKTAAPLTDTLMSESVIVAESENVKSEATYELTAVATTSPAKPNQNSTAEEPKKLKLSIPTIIGMIIMLICISEFFVWSIIDRKDSRAQVTKNLAAKNETGDKAKSSHTPASPVVIHDTVRIVEIPRRVVPQAYTPSPAVAAAPVIKPAATTQANAAAAPTLPVFDYLYADKPYYFDLKTPLLSDVEFELYSDNANITALGKNTFYVKPTKPGSINIMVLDKGAHMKIAERSYTVKNKPLPLAAVGDYILPGGFVSPKLLLAKLTMQAKAENVTYKVTSFRMTCKSGTCDINDVSNDGKFNESMIRFLQNVKAGEQLLFDNVIAEGENGQAIKLDDFQVTTY